MSAVYDRRNIDWLIAVQVMARTRQDAREIERLIPLLSAEQEGFQAIAGAEPGAFLMGARGEAELERNFTLLRDRMTGSLDVGAPEVGYRETIGRAAQVDHRRDARSGGVPRLSLAVEPHGVAAGQTFDIQFAPPAPPYAARRALEQGIARELDRGPIVGYPVIGVLVTVLEVACDGAEPSARALERAAWVVLRDALCQAGPLLLEPIMKFEAVTPVEFQGALCADLASRRCQLMSSGTREDDGVTVAAEVPLANLFGYANSLRAMTDGRARYSVSFSHYARVPGAPNDEPPNDGSPDDEPPDDEPASAALRA